MTVLNMDCIEGMRAMPDDSVDAVVTDPPYGLSDHKPADVVACLAAWLAGEEYRPKKKGFMGRAWDSWVPGPEVWREVFRVLKPGGHVVAFAGSRTHDLMSMALRLAGFECRDTVMWCYGQGFPKNLNVTKDLENKNAVCRCPPGDNHLPGLRGVARNAGCVVQEGKDPDVQPSVQWKAAGGGAGQASLQENRTSRAKPETSGQEQSRMEGRRDHAAPARELCSGQVCESACGSFAHGSQGRVCDGASPGDGEVDRADSAQGRSGSPCGSRPSEQRSIESGAVAGQSQPQAVGAWPVCGGCGLPRVPSGLGTALKPAFEPALLFRKPLIGTVAANVLEHGTGALNIDGCRVATHGESTVRPESLLTSKGAKGGGYGQTTGRPATGGVTGHDSGRFPANIIHDGSPEVLAMFPTQAGAAAPVHKRNGDKFRNSYGAFAGNVDEAGGTFHGDSGSAARFFYCAKASRADRNEGLPAGDAPAVTQGASMSDKENADWKARNGNFHPTVKPTDLMRYLCRLVTPPGGVVLDPFAGSGSTGKAAVLEGFKFTGFELDSEFAEIAKARIDAARPKPIAVLVDAGQLDLFGERVA